MTVTPTLTMTIGGPNADVSITSPFTSTLSNTHTNYMVSPSGVADGTANGAGDWAAKGAADGVASGAVNGTGNGTVMAPLAGPSQFMGAGSALVSSGSMLVLVAFMAIVLF